MSATPSSPTTTPKRLSSPYNGVLYVTVRSASPEKPLPEIGGNMAAELGSTWADSVVVAVEEIPQEGTGRKAVQITHARVPSVEAQITNRHNWEHSTADIGGRKFSSMAITVIQLSSSYSETTPAIGSAMPDLDPGQTQSQFSESAYLLADRQSVMSGTELEPVFRVEVRNYVKRVALIDHDFDDALGGDLKTEEKLYFRGELISGQPVETVFSGSVSGYWGLQGGLVRTGKQLSDNWFSVVERQIVPPAFAENGRTYETTMDFTWPAVLSGFDIDTWNLRDGGYQQYVTPLFSKEAYSGPCRATVTETFYSTPPVRSATQTMRPMPISMSTPIIDISVGPTLHGNQSINLSVGSNHPRFEETVGSWSFPATNYTAWPTSLLASSKVDPMRGGYLKTDVIVYPPTDIAPDPVV